MSIKAMTIVWECAPVSGSDLLLLLALADFVRDDNLHSFPGNRRLAHMCRCDIRSVPRILKRLEESGCLERIEQARQGRGVRRVFRITPERWPVPPPLGKGWQAVTLSSGAKKGDNLPPFPVKGDNPVAKGGQSQPERMTIPTQKDDTAAPPEPLRTVGAERTDARERASRPRSLSLDDLAVSLPAGMATGANRGQYQTLLDDCADHALLRRAIVCAKRDAEQPGGPAPWPEHIAAHYHRLESEQQAEQALAAQEARRAEERAQARQAEAERAKRQAQLRARVEELCRRAEADPGAAQALAAAGYDDHALAKLRRCPNPFRVLTAERALAS